MENLTLRSRRIVRAHNSRIISIPPVWMDAWEGKIGDYVSIEIGQDHELIIRPLSPEGKARLDEFFGTHFITVLPRREQ